MNVINIAEAKTHLSKLIELALKGEEVIIGKRNTPLIKFTVINPQKKEKRKGGRFKGQIHIADDFDVLPDEIQRAFEGLEE